MLSIFFIYFVGKSFYELAEKHGKSDWGFAILGVASYYFGIFAGGFIIGMIFELNSPGYIDESNERWIGILGLPIGLGACWGTYQLLKRSWSKPKEVERSATLDGDLISSNIHPEDSRYDQSER